MSIIAVSFGFIFYAAKYFLTKTKRILHETMLKIYEGILFLISYRPNKRTGHVLFTQMKKI